MSSVYVNAKFINYDPNSISTSFDNQGSELVFEKNSSEVITSDAFSEQTNYKNSSSAFYDNLINLNFDLTSLEGQPYVSNVDLSRIYINLERKEDVDCIDRNNPLGGLIDKRPSRTGTATISNPGGLNESTLEYWIREYEALFYSYHS
jgi:hypothetical protein